MIRAAKIIAVLAVLIAPWMLDLSKSSSVAADSNGKAPVTQVETAQSDAFDCESNGAMKTAFAGGGSSRRPRFFRPDRNDWRQRYVDDWDADTQYSQSAKWELTRTFFHIVFDPNSPMLSELIRQINTRLILSSLSNG